MRTLPQTQDTAGRYQHQEGDVHEIRQNLIQKVTMGYQDWNQILLKSGKIKILFASPIHSNCDRHTSKVSQTSLFSSTFLALGIVCSHFYRDLKHLRTLKTTFP